MIMLASALCLLLLANESSRVAAFTAACKNDRKGAELEFTMLQRVFNERNFRYFIKTL